MIIKTNWQLQDMQGLICMYLKPPVRGTGGPNLWARELLFLDNELWCSPIIHDRECILAVTRTSRRSAVMKLCHAKSIQLVDQQEPGGPAEVATCLQFTMTAKLAPSWNIVGSSLVQGRDFIQESSSGSTNGTLTSTKFKMTIDGDGKISISLDASRVKLPIMKLENLHLPGEELERLKQTGFLGFSAPHEDLTKRVKLLPWLSEGTLCSISTRIPSSAPFADYNALKKYWKNMYGYRLPETEPMYANVAFSSDCVFTYPLTCVLRSNVVVKNNTMSMEHVHEIVAAFVRDFTKIAAKCSDRIKSTAPTNVLPLFTDPNSLDSAADKNKTTDRANLSAMPVMPRIVPPEASFRITNNLFIRAYQKLTQDRMTENGSQLQTTSNASITQPVNPPSESRKMSLFAHIAGKLPAGVKGEQHQCQGAATSQTSQAAKRKIAASNSVAQKRASQKPKRPRKNLEIEQ